MVEMANPIRDHYDKLYRVLTISSQTLDSLANKCYEAHYIDLAVKSDATQQPKGASTLLDHLILKIESNQDNLPKIISLMGKVESLTDIVNKMDPNLHTNHCSTDSRASNKEPMNVSQNGNTIPVLKDSGIAGDTEIYSKALPKESPEPSASIPSCDQISTDSDKVPHSLPSSFADDVISNIPLREYQRELAEPGLNGENYIVCAPTGSGKTLVAALIIKKHLLEKKKAGIKGTVLFVVKTQQLAYQQRNKLEQYLAELGVTVLEITGESDSPIYLSLPKVDVIVCTSGKLHHELCAIKDIDIKVSFATLLILDECHHTIKGDLYAVIMEHYLVEKQAGLNVPQVIGMTASPGAGRGKYPTLSQVITYQQALCARLNATSGIKCVVTHKDELSKHVHSPCHSVFPLPQRDCADPFINEVRETMIELENMLPVKSLPTFSRCSLAYQQWIKNEIESAQISGIDEQRDQVSILKQLDSYVLALITYNDFELKNAMEILELEVSFHEDERLNDMEKKLKEIHLHLKHVLSIKCNQVQPNPLLLKCAQLLFQHFSSKQDSKGLFFVRAVKHTQYVADWIKSHPELSKLIRPSPISGYSRKGMTKQEQVSTIEKFRSGEFNLLVSTSVVEEGLDIPDCNFIIRFQILSNEVADVQAEGRARAEESTVHTVVVSKSHTHHNQLINSDKKELALKAVRYLSKPEINLSYLKDLQDEILYQREQRLKAEHDRKAIWKVEDVELLCSKCGVFACEATSVSKYGTHSTSPHYIVSLASFINEKMIKMKRKSKSEPAFISDFSRPFKIHCIECNEEWGIWGCWKNGAQYPVLKCTSFVFRNKKTKGREKYRQWKMVPFDVLFYNEYVEPQED